MRQMRVDGYTISSEISPPDVGVLSRRFEGAMATLIKDVDSISDHLIDVVHYLYDDFYYYQY